MGLFIVAVTLDAPAYPLGATRIYSGKAGFLRVETLGYNSCFVN